MTRILTTTKVAKKVNATAKDEKYNYSVEYSATEDENKTLENLSIRVDSLNGNTFVGTVGLQTCNSDRNYSLKEGSDVAVISTMAEAIIAEVKSTLTV